MRGINGEKMIEMYDWYYLVIIIAIISFSVYKIVELILQYKFEQYKHGNNKSN